MSVPVIDIAALFAGPTTARDHADRAILAAAHRIGFLPIVGLPPEMPMGAQSRAALLRIFDLEPAAQHKLWRQKFEPGNPNVYRGWFPLQPGNVTGSASSASSSFAACSRCGSRPAPRPRGSPEPERLELPAQLRDHAGVGIDAIP